MEYGTLEFDYSLSDLRDSDTQLIPPCIRYVGYF